MCKNLQTYEIGQTCDSLRRRHFLLICRQVIWIITSNIWQYRWCCTSPWRWLDEIKCWKKVSSPAESLCNEQSSSVFPIQLLLAARWNLCTRYARYNESTYFRQLWNHRGPFWRLFTFPSAVCFWISTNSFSLEFRNLKTFSALYVWICVLGLMYCI
jgi:hypothetical protein